MKKAGAVLLAWGENMTSYNTYLNMMPKMGADGVPDRIEAEEAATEDPSSVPNKLWNSSTDKSPEPVKSAPVPI